MARIILVTGGARSGKSGYAQQLAESAGQPGTRMFLATCPILDEEMRQRVQRHRSARAGAGAGWNTVEEQRHIAQVIASDTSHETILVDCLTLWLNNWLFHFDQIGHPMTEDDAAAKAQELLAAAARHHGTIIFVTNEVGLGVVPENELARRFRDIAGRCNQIIGRGADEVTLLCCGIPLAVKRS